jgi:excisionase family DNA binding protein
MRIYTTQEAAELTGSSVRALRKRIERGQLRAVQHGRYWRIPHSELERAGLIGPAEASGDREGEGTNHDLKSILLALERERAENARLTRELARLRPLTAQIEEASADLHQERAQRQAAEAREAQAASVAAELRARQRELAEAGFIDRWRLISELRPQPHRNIVVAGMSMTRSLFERWRKQGNG